MIKEVRPGTHEYERVIELGNANSVTLGFLPYEAIEQAAVDGRVLAFVDDGEVKGYALFGKRVRTGDISLTHLCVDRDQRGQGIAGALVEGIVSRNPHRAGIRLSCRKDYEANAMWPHLGFQPHGERPGRGRERMPLVTWWRPIAAHALFGEPETKDARVVAAIDTNVLLDILEERDFPASRALAADWVAETAELVVAPQSHSETSAQRPRSERLRTGMGGFKTLEPPESAWCDELQSFLADPDLTHVREGDLRLVAQASAGGAAYLISRDQDLLRRAELIEHLTGLNLVGPDDFLLRLQSLGGEHGRQAQSIAASGLSVASASELPSNTELSGYCHHSLGERPSDLRRRLSLAIANGGRVERLVAQTGEALALGAMHPKQTSVAVTALRCAPGPLAYSAARQMVHHLRAIVGQSGPVSVVVDDQTRPPVDQALRDEGFRPEGSAWNAIVRTGVLGPRDPLPQELEHVGWERLNAHLVRDYERYAWPSKVFSGQVASYMVPIKHEYARVILGYDEPQGRLIELNPRAAASRDNAYYRSPRTLEAPARIIWWVSGGGPVGGMRAMSWLDEVETGHPSRLYRKYRHYGVLDELQVRAAASQMGGGSPKATVMLFSQTEVFSEPVPISRARQLCDSMSRTGFFQTTQAIDEHAVRRFYEEGMSQNAR